MAAHSAAPDRPGGVSCPLRRSSHQPVTATPVSLPTPYVTPAAAKIDERLPYPG
jgi:hypothetical protein